MAFHLASTVSSSALSSCFSYSCSEWKLSQSFLPNSMQDSNLGRTAFFSSLSACHVCVTVRMGRSKLNRCTYSTHSNTGTHLLHPLQHRYAPTPPTPTQVRTYSTHSNTGTHLLHPPQHRYAPTPPTPTQVRTYSTHSNTGTDLLHPLQHRYTPTPPTPTQVRTHSTHSNTATHLLHPLQHR